MTGETHIREPIEHIKTFTITQNVKSSVNLHQSFFLQPISHSFRTLSGGYSLSSLSFRFCSRGGRLSGDSGGAMLFFMGDDDADCCCCGDGVRCADTAKPAENLSLS